MGGVKSKETRPRSKRTGWARHSLPTDPEGGLAVQDSDDGRQVHLHLVLGQHWREKLVQRLPEARRWFSAPPRPDAGSAPPRPDAGPAPPQGGLRPTVLPEFEALLELLPSVRLGADAVAPLLGLGDHRVFEVQDASGHGLVQPLGNAVPSGVLTVEGEGGLSEASKVRKPTQNCFFYGLTSSSTSLYWEREQKRALARGYNGLNQNRSRNLNEFLPCSSRPHRWKPPRVRIDSDVGVRLCAR